MIGLIGWNILKSFHTHARAVPVTLGPHDPPLIPSYSQSSELRESRFKSLFFFSRAQSISKMRIYQIPAHNTEDVSPRSSWSNGSSFVSPRLPIVTSEREPNSSQAIDDYASSRNSIERLRRQFEVNAAQTPLSDGKERLKRHSSSSGQHHEGREEETHQGDSNTETPNSNQARDEYARSRKSIERLRRQFEGNTPQAALRNNQENTQQHASSNEEPTSQTRGAEEGWEAFDTGKNFFQKPEPSDEPRPSQIKSPETMRLEQAILYSNPSLLPRGGDQLPALVSPASESHLSPKPNSPKEDREKVEVFSKLVQDLENQSTKSLSLDEETNASDKIDYAQKPFCCHVLALLCYLLVIAIVSGTIGYLWPSS